MSTRVSKLIKEGKIGAHHDATEPLWVVVSEIDVYRGLASAPDQCVLAKASLRAVPNSLKCIFYENAAYIAVIDIKTGKKSTTRYIPSPEAKKAIATYDMTGKFPVGKYRLDAPSGSNTMKAIKDRHEKRKGRHEPSNTRIKRQPVDLKLSCDSLKVGGKGKKRTPRVDSTRRCEKQPQKRARLQFALA